MNSKYSLTNSVNKSFIAVLINPDKGTEKIDPAQQNLQAESSYELIFDYNQVISGLGNPTNFAGPLYWSF